MWDYTETVMDHFYNPRNQGAIADPEEPGIAVVYGEIGSIACGDALRLHLKIEVAQDKILDARFQTFGCTSAIASSSALTEIIKGKTLDEALNITNQDIAEFLGGLPEAKMHCSVMGQEALEAAIFKYRGIEVEHHDEDEGKMICTCFGVSDTRIRRVIIDNSLTSVEQVTSYVKAGGGCGSCLAEIEDILGSVLEETAATARRVSELTHKAPDPKRPLTTVQKINLIQQVLDAEVRPILKADGGDVELFDVDGNTVKVILHGACGSCAGSTVTLKDGIEVRLRERVSPELVVEAVTAW